MVPLLHISIDVVLLTLLLVLAVGIAAMRNLFAAVMLASGFSLVMAALFVLLDAVDVAFTEAAVGAGLSTILMLAAMSLAPSTEYRSRLIHWPALLAVLTSGALMIFGTLDLPPHGAPDAPVHTHVAPEYFAQVEKEIGIPNVVTAILAAWRGFDTLGEVYVIFAAGLIVLALFALPRPNITKSKPDENP